MAHHAGPKMGVGRFQLGFFKVLYLQRESGSELSLNGFEDEHIYAHIYIIAAASGFCKGAHHTATLSAVVAETIEPATRGIPMATACKCAGQQSCQTDAMPIEGP